VSLRLCLVAAVVAAGPLVAAAPSTAQPTPTVNDPGPASAAPRLAVQASLTPASAFFGDPVTALVTVDYDASAVQGSSVRVEADFEPFEQTGTASVTTRRVGTEVTAFYRYGLQCLGDGCLPTSSTRLIRLHPVVVIAVSGRAQISASGQVPALLISSRLQSSDLAGSTPPFRFPAQMPPAVYRLSPAGLGDALIALAAVLATGALALVGLEISRALTRSRARRVRVLTPLEAALEATRQAALRPDAADRRKAIGILARILSATGHRTLAESSDGVAWSETPPSPTRAQTLADDVESSLEQENR
jgi:hypothetical protein